MSDQLRRTLTLLETLLDYLPGPQMIRSQADAVMAQSDSARPRTYTPAERDRQIAHLQLCERMRGGGQPGGEPWEGARREQYATGDYAALDAALARLEVANRRHYDLAWRVATHHPGLLDLELRVELVRTIVWIGARLPRPVRLPAWATSSTPPTPLHLATLRDLGVPYAVLARVYGRDVSALRRRAKKAIA